MHPDISMWLLGYSYVYGPDVTRKYYDSLYEGFWGDKNG